MARREQFDEISASATQSIDEVKQIAYNLRPYHLDKLGLGTSIEAMTERIGASSDIEFTVNCPVAERRRAEGSGDQRLSASSRSRSTTSSSTRARRVARSTSRTMERDLVITIADNGKGFDAKAARAVTIGSGFGLAGVAERVGMLGGRHSIVSVTGSGDDGDDRADRAGAARSRRMTRSSPC